MQTELDHHCNSLIMMYLLYSLMEVLETTRVQTLIIMELVVHLKLLKENRGEVLPFKREASLSSV
jgi:hypothetical protein